MWGLLVINCFHLVIMLLGLGAIGSGSGHNVDL